MRHHTFTISALLFLSFVVNAQQPWPVLKTYDQEHIQKIALPIGGIGTGTVSLSGRGSLVDWEIMNRPGKGYSTILHGNDAPFFAIHVENKDGEKHTKGLFGPLYYYEYEHMEGRPVDHHGIPRFRHASFETTYPFGIVRLWDEKMPVKVSIKAFNPLIPGDADKSGIPIAILRYEVTNTTGKPLTVSVCGSIRNFIGRDGSKYHIDWKGDRIYEGAKDNKNKYFEKGELKGIYFYSEGVDPADEAWGTMALTTHTGNVTYRTSSVPNVWENAILDFWDDFSDDGLLVEKTKQADPDPMASLSNTQVIPPHGTRTFEFFLTWHFPNRRAWSKEIIGNYYTTQYKDALDVIEKAYPQLPELEKETILFVKTFLRSDLPEVVKEAALFNVSTLRSQTVFRIPSGHLMGWEGCMDTYGSCAGSCTHVWNYEQATPFLFGELAKTMRDVEFGYATRDNGAMSFRAALPLAIAGTKGGVAADGQMGTIMKMFREWQLSGDDAFLQRLWPKVKNAMEYTWLEGSWDADADGVMEGSQHNTMDVNYSGPNPQMQFWYLGALKAIEKMALAMGDKKFAKKCAAIYRSGAAWTEENLFNGEYYEQQVLDPDTKEVITDYSSHNMPRYQLAKGCLVDQLVGQYMAHICNLGYLGSKEHKKTTLQSIMKYNYLNSFEDHFNNMRSYVLGDEKGLLMASWPKGRPKVPFPYFNEVMTGFEYTAAVGMICEGMTSDGLKCITNIRDRYDGRKRSPFDEAECGHHYARAMASWAAVLTLTGFHYSAVDATIEFAPHEGTFFWSDGYAWGTVTIRKNGEIYYIKLIPVYGDIKIRKIILTETGTGKIKEKMLRQGETLSISIQSNVL